MGVMKKIYFDKVFYGATTLGEKGQVVIPAEARRFMKINKGEKLLAFGIGKDMLVFTKFSQLQEIVKHLSANLKGVQKIIESNKK